MKSKEQNLDKLQKTFKEQQTLASKDSLFCFAAYLPPGYHHFLIYDHARQKVFIKETIVPLRDSTFIYPEQIQNYFKIKPPRVNVWRLWVEDTQMTETLVYTSDLTSGLYEPQLLIKSNELLEQVKEFQMDRRSDYKIFYRELVARSQNYPKISFSEVYRILKYFMDKEEIEVPRAFVELSFQKTIRKQNVNLLKGALCRAELMDFIIRIVDRLNQKNIFNGLINFTDQHIKPIADASEIPQHRKLIRQCLRTNDLLQQNKTFLEEIFNSQKEGFTRKAAVSLICTDLQTNTVPPMLIGEDATTWMPDQPPREFSPPFDPLYQQLPTETVLRCFSYSLMTVINEQTNYKKYNYCLYVEFLEFICRIAINLYSNFKRKSIYEKTKDLLEILLIRNNFIKKRDNGVEKVEGKKKQQKKEEESYQIIEPSDDSDLN